VSITNSQASPEQRRGSEFEGIQIPNSNSSLFGFWNLVLDVCLVIGDCDLEFVSDFDIRYSALNKPAASRRLVNDRTSILLLDAQFEVVVNLRVRHADLVFEPCLNFEVGVAGDVGAGAFEFAFSQLGKMGVL
jgi:hypothetical protein